MSGIIALILSAGEADLDTGPLIHNAEPLNPLYLEQAFAMVYIPQPLAKKTTILTLKRAKSRGEKFAMVALYDAPMAAMAEKTGVEVLLVGDSLGMTVLGYDSTVPVTMEQMIYHIEAVARGSALAFIIGDLPFMTYASADLAIQNATRVMQAGANMVKMEGGRWLTPTIRMLSEQGIPVCAHLGLTPQSVNKLGGFRVQGRDRDTAAILIDGAKAVEQAGADMLVLECIPPELAATITDSVNIPTVGIGAGHKTDAQVLVINDILGLTEQPPKFSKNFLVEAQDIPGALAKYVGDVKAGIFPEEQHSFT